MSIKPYNLVIKLPQGINNDAMLSRLLIQLKAIKVQSPRNRTGSKKPFGTVTFELTTIFGDADIICTVDYPLGSGHYLVPLRTAADRLLKTVLKDYFRDPPIIIWFTPSSILHPDD